MEFDEEYIEGKFLNHTESVLNILYRADQRGEELSVSDITDKSDTNYNHCHDIVSEFIDNNLAEKQNSTGRSKPVVLTDKGREVAEIIHAKISRLEELSNSM